MNTSKTTTYINTTVNKMKPEIAKLGYGQSGGNGEMNSQFWISLMAEFANKFASHPTLSEDRRKQILEYIATLIDASDLNKTNYGKLKLQPQSNPVMLALLYIFLETTAYDIKIINFAFDHNLTASDVMVLLMVNNMSDLNDLGRDLKLSQTDIKILTDLKRQSAFQKINNNW